MTLKARGFRFGELLRVVSRLLTSKGVTRPIFTRVKGSSCRSQGFRCTSFLSGGRFRGGVERYSILVARDNMTAVVTNLGGSGGMVIIPQLTGCKRRISSRRMRVTRSFSGRGCMVVYARGSGLRRLVVGTGRRRFTGCASREERVMGAVRSFLNGVWGSRDKWAVGVSIVALREIQGCKSSLRALTARVFLGRLKYRTRVVSCCPRQCDDGNLLGELGGGDEGLKDGPVLLLVTGVTVTPSCCGGRLIFSRFLEGRVSLASGACCSRRSLVGSVPGTSTCYANDSRI